MCWDIHRFVRVVYYFVSGCKFTSLESNTLNPKPKALKAADGFSTAKDFKDRFLQVSLSTPNPRPKGPEHKPIRAKIRERYRGKREDRKKCQIGLHAQVPCHRKLHAVSLQWGPYLATFFFANLLGGSGDLLSSYFIEL